MRFWRRQTEALASVGYSAVVAAVRKRRATREESPTDPDVSLSTIQSGVRAYRPEGRLFQREREVRRLVEDARDIPRKWEPDPLITPPPISDEWLVDVCLFGGASLSAGTIVLILGAAARINPYALIAFAISGFGALFALSVYAWQQASTGQKLHLVAVLIVLILSVGIVGAYCTRQ